MDATQIILIAFIVLLIIAYPIMITLRNRRENQRITEQTNSLKRGDKVLTTSGVYGTIVDLQLENEKKIVTIETGTDKKKGYISVDAYAIYHVYRDEEVSQQTLPAQATTEESSVQEETKTSSEETVSEEKQEIVSKKRKKKE